MAVPGYEDFMLPVLRLIADGKETIDSCEGSLTEQLKLTADDLNTMLPSGKQSIFRNRAHWARTYLSKAGLVKPIKRGHFQLTPKGAEVLAKNPAKIDNSFLTQFPEFIAFKTGVPVSNGSTDIASIPPANAVSSETPDAIIDSAFKEIESALAEQLISAVLSLSPTRFEDLIVDLLVAMGYGGGDKSMGERLGKSGDGGIDGVINEDKLGLDAVYIQAKRYALGSNIGRPALQAFVGSLTGEGATKGVFVTTSDFSKEARDYLNKVQHRIVLINGDRLARLLIQHNVGVRARRTYVLRSIDEDFFADE